MNRTQGAVGCEIAVAEAGEDDLGEIELVDQPIAIVIIEVRNERREHHLRRRREGCRARCDR